MDDEYSSGFDPYGYGLNILRHLAAHCRQVYGNAGLIQESRRYDKKIRA